MSTKTSFYASPQDLERMAQLADWWQLPSERYNGAVLKRALEIAFSEEEKSRRICEDCGGVLTYLKYSSRWVCERCDLDDPQYD